MMSAEVMDIDGRITFLRVCELFAPTDMIVFVYGICTIDHSRHEDDPTAGMPVK